MKKLFIVESPAKAKKIQEFLGNEYIVRASMGHIADLLKGGHHGIGVDLDNSFKAKYGIIQDHLQIVDELITLAENCSIIYLGTDNDREGTAISWHLKQRLPENKVYKRVVFNAITKKDIQNSIQNAGEININQFHAQEARRILDRLVGFMASPFLMNFFGPKLSAGRVQSVVTKMIIDREREIESFKPEEYWVIKANLAKDSIGSLAFLAKYEPKVNNQSKALEVKKVLEGNALDAKYIVTQVSASEEVKKPNPPMITSQLQRVMAKSFGFSADQTMKAAQSLYENGYVTYIRTDSVRVEPDAIKNLREWLKDNKYEAPKSANSFKTKGEAQDAHECIRPTDLNLGPDNMELIGDEKKVYEIIWKYFVASQMAPAIYDTLKVTIQLKDKKDHILKASGKALKKQGFLEIMGVNDDSKIEIPLLLKGDELSLSGKMPVSIERKQTQPPPRYSNDTLIEMMEKKNIGRPATYAEILSKITSRNYVEMEGKTYRPTDLGKKVTDALTEFFSFMSYDYTKLMEQKLDEIENGKQDHIKTLEEFFKPFKIELNKAYVAHGSSLCEKCESVMMVRTAKNGDKFLGCSAFPRCSFTKPISDSKNAA